LRQITDNVETEVLHDLLAGANSSAPTLPIATTPNGATARIRACSDSDDAFWSTPFSIPMSQGPLQLLGGSVLVKVKRSQLRGIGMRKIYEHSPAGLTSSLNKVVALQLRRVKLRDPLWMVRDSIMCSTGSASGIAVQRNKLQL